MENPQYHCRFATLIARWFIATETSKLQRDVGQAAFTASPKPFTFTQNTTDEKDP